MGPYFIQYSLIQKCLSLIKIIFEHSWDNDDLLTKGRGDGVNRLYFQASARYGLRSAFVLDCSFFVEIFEEYFVLIVLFWLRLWLWWEVIILVSYISQRGRIFLLLLWCFCFGDKRQWKYLQISVFFFCHNGSVYTVLFLSHFLRSLYWSQQAHFPKERNHPPIQTWSADWCNGKAFLELSTTNLSCVEWFGYSSISRRLLTLS